MKWLVRIFLPLSFILFCDLALSANSLQDSYIFAQTSLKKDKANGSNITKLTGRHKHKNHHNLPDEEFKDDSNESSSHKKIAERDNFACHFFYTRVAAINGHYLKTGYNLNRFPRYTTSNKLYRSISVFRI
ncbi:hypothetical protein [Mucilaginibacter terrae]|uniref:Uncharacterized protein n=1 Tax=Mucilaginibacter terrae TaxID=1955052 RepID=A0ABU3H0E2_9SPHI|nr:hypothetical protein [Mucilaginibacter terrae]MDT3405488.1 hypothetical protein [Mucilaginibacter terrae]